MDQKSEHLESKALRYKQEQIDPFKASLALPRASSRFHTCTSLRHRRFSSDVPKLLPNTSFPIYSSLQSQSEPILFG